MIILKGESVFNGIEIGRLCFYHKHDCRIEKTYTENTEQELRRFQSAKERVYQELEDLHAWALQQMSAEDAEIFAAHQMILEDPEFIDAVACGVEQQHLSAEYAVQTAVEHFTGVFASLEDEQIQARVADLQDIGIRLLGYLEESKMVCKDKNVAENVFPFVELSVSYAGMTGEDKVILAAVDLLPSELAKLDSSKILGFVSQGGSVHSHAAILARNRKIPAVMKLGESLSRDYDGALAILDGTEGKIYIDPDEETIEHMKEKRHLEEEQEAVLQNLIGKEDITLNGQRMDVFANIGNVADLSLVKENDARGIGLFRTECFYLEREELPTEEEQFQVYKTVAEQMNGKRVIIRTLDIGADKKPDYLPLKQEDNPALGCRGIRICLTEPKIFKTQLRAIYRASVYGQLAMMFPMITSVQEVKHIQGILKEVREELEQEGASYDKTMQIGIMIETPAAVMVSRELAKEVDFFSIGTNDLTQYTLAIDRRNPKLQAFYDAHHPAILAMIQMVADHAHAEGKWVGICGELAADRDMTETFLKMRIDELSVAPAMVLPLRKKIREME